MAEPPQKKKEQSQGDMCNIILEGSLWITETHLIQKQDIHLLS